MNTANLLDMVPESARSELARFMEARGEPRYRVDQVMRHLWREPAASISNLTALPASLREALGSAFSIPRLGLVDKRVSVDGTAKYLFRLGDGQEVETVSIPEGSRNTICISSQAGCALQCSFCATGAMGFARNLSTFEIAAQVREMFLLEPDRPPTNIVFMGMGEPLMNWKSVDKVLTILNSSDGLGIGARHITVSTVGVLPGIQALASRKEQFRLALSIHAPTDELRQTLMPINTRYPLADVVGAAAAFGRRVTFEYVMLGGVNDQSIHAEQLADLARRCGAFINLIPLHPGGVGSFVPTPPQGIAAFAAMLRSRGVEVAVRRSRGVDIAAACGQLRAERIRRRAPVLPQDHGNINV